jgi:hypothetical protein
VKRKVGVFAHDVYVCRTEREDRHHWNGQRGAISETTRRSGGGGGKTMEKEENPQIMLFSLF